MWSELCAPVCSAATAGELAERLREKGACRSTPLPSCFGFSIPRRIFIPGAALKDPILEALPDAYSENAHDERWSVFGHT